MYSKNLSKTATLKKTKIVYQYQLSLNAGQKYCILQYFQPSLRYHLSLRSSFCLFLSGRFTVYKNPCYNEVCYEGAALYMQRNNHQNSS